MIDCFKILNIENEPEHNLIQIECLIGDERRKYKLKFERLGVTIPGELENILTQKIKRNKQFMEIVFAFHEGKTIKFPIDLSNV